MPRTTTSARNLVTIDDAARQLGLNHRTIRRYIAAGRLRAHRVGGKLIRIDQADLDALIRPIPAASAGGDAWHPCSGPRLPPGKRLRSSGPMPSTR
jgi:excisionase family DNA binding protein